MGRCCSTGEHLETHSTWANPAQGFLSAVPSVVKTRLQLSCSWPEEKQSWPPKVKPGRGDLVGIFYLVAYPFVPGLCFCDTSNQPGFAIFSNETIFPSI